jgi:hypothetical protein
MRDRSWNDGLTAVEGVFELNLPGDKLVAAENSDYGHQRRRHPAGRQ